MQSSVFFLHFPFCSSSFLNQSFILSFSFFLYSNFPKISDSRNKNTSSFSSPILIFIPPYSGNNTLSPTLNVVGCKFPVTSRSPGPTATISPSFGSLVVSVGKNKPEDNCVSFGARFTNTRSASGCNLRNNVCCYVTLCYVLCAHEVHFWFVCKKYSIFQSAMSVQANCFILI
jgi:hypothetical protein